MRNEIHLEEIRHLFDEHLPMILEIAAAWPRDAEGVALAHTAGEPMPEAFEKELVDILWRNNRKEPRVHARPMDFVRITSKRADVIPPDAQSAREGRSYPVPPRYLVPDPTVVQPVEPLNVNRFYPNEPQHQTAIAGDGHGKEKPA